MKDKKYNELKINTIIIAIANLGSKAITFILAPLYSYFLTVEQYGNMDMIITTVGLLMPIICFDVFEGTFRYSSDKEYDYKKIFSSSIAIFLIGAIINIIFSIFLCIKIKKFAFFIFINIIFALFDAFNGILSQYLRGKNYITKFAFSGIISSVVLLISNILFLCILKKQLKGWICAFFISKIFLTLYLLKNVLKDNPFSFKYIDKKYMKILFKFCIPLMPTATMWWIMNVSDRYLITAFIGIGATGIYSVANKIPTILSVFENVFYQAWQTTAIKYMNDENRDKLYSKVFNKYFEIMVIGIIGIFVLGDILIKILFEKSYYDAWWYMGPLILAVLFHALSGNLGSLYSVFKKTKGAFYSSLVGALANIILNFIFIPRFGLMGAAITTCIGYFVTLMYRIFDVKKYANIKIDRKSFVVMSIFLIIQIILYYKTTIFSYCLRILIFIFLILSKRDLIREVLIKE